MIAVPTLAYFPEIYPGELLYSVLARYHRHVGSTSAKHTLEDLFGHVHAAGVDFQGFLGALCMRIPPARGLSPKRLARQYTHFPYYTAFQSKPKSEEVFRALTHGSATGIHRRLGLSGSLVTRPTHFQFCQACHAEMLHTYGELYWRRDHQLPGVLVCPDHCLPLIKSTVWAFGHNRMEFVVAHESNCCPHAESEAWMTEAHTIELLSRIARRSSALLTTPRQQDCENLTEGYHRAVSALGFGNGSRIAQGRLSEAYNRLPYPIISLVRANDWGGTCRNWLAPFIKKHDRTFHPLKHLLFQLFLEEMSGQEVSLQQLLEVKPKPFGHGPWICLNHLADHYKQAVITQLCVRRINGRTRGYFTCGCGQVYSLGNEPNSTLRIIDRGPLFAERLRALISRGSNVQAAAEALSVAPCVVRLHIAKLGIPPPWKARRYRHKPRKRRRGHLKKNRSPHNRDVIRLRWLAAQRSEENLSQKQLERLLPTEFRWLYHHDKDWLKRNSPARRKAAARLDWAAIDRDLEAALREKVNELRQEEPPRRITVNELECRIVMPHGIRMRIKKLPLTAATLKRIVETAGEFRLRRMTWAERTGQKPPKPFR